MDGEGGGGQIDPPPSEKTTLKKSSLIKVKVVRPKSCQEGGKEKDKERQFQSVIH